MFIGLCKIKSLSMVSLDFTLLFFEVYLLDDKTTKAMTDENNWPVYAVLYPLAREMLFGKSQDTGLPSSFGQDVVAVYRQPMRLIASPQCLQTNGTHTQIS